MFRILTPLLAVAALGACSDGIASKAEAAPQPRVTATAQHPTVVELYQSQGCSSCPPANAAVNAIATRPDVLALSFAVTYWDQLGWKDTFADPAYTRRQWDYAKHAGRSNVATPQVIVNGGAPIVGSNPGQLAQTIAARGPARGGPELTPVNTGVRVGADKNGSLVWLVRYDPRVRQVAVRAGENGGRTLPHRNIVRELTLLGKTSAAPETLGVPVSRAGLASAILTQNGSGGPITGALRL